MWKPLFVLFVVCTVSDNSYGILRRKAAQNDISK